MTKLAKHTAARLWLVILGIVALGMTHEYLSRNPPEPGTFLGQVWAIVAR